MKRIAVAGFQHETNTFAPGLATYPDFEEADAWPGLLKNDEVLRQLSGLKVSLTGFTDAAMLRGGYDIIPVLWCAAEPSSYVTNDAFERIASQMVEGIRNAGELDGIYLELHGAMVTQDFEDGEGELLRRIRELTGPDLPVAVSFDLHANITPEIIRHASSINIFRTYPHIDLVETGERSFVSMERLLTSGPLYKAFRQVPFLVPLTSQHTWSQPCRSIYASLESVSNETLFSADIAMGFPPADIYHAGPSVIAYAGTQGDADEAADVLLEVLIDAENDFDDVLLSVEEAVTEAMAHVGPRPIVIADAQDNAGAGASSDTTGLLSELVRSKAQGAVLAILNDVEVAAQAHELGKGAEFSTLLGGKSGQDDQYPYAGRFRIEALSNGEFPFTGPMYDGMTASLGLMAVLRVLDTPADVRVVIGSVRSQCLDQAILTHIGIEPTEQRIVAVKSSVHFRADFEPIADKVLVVEAPGAHPCRLDRLNYKNLRPGVRLGPGGRPHREAS
ncbi:MAG: M81 family metallopeptidase [Gammaproteobacteria bacterium]|nr:M81 family metallopeptidase [Gammaproteobacteria bacterium]